MGQVAALVVTHDSSRWIAQTLDSIAAQTMQPDTVVVIDDASTDDTLAIVGRFDSLPVTVHASTTTDVEPVDRIAANFKQGLRACTGVDIVVIGDHDDVWLPDRIAQQSALLDADSAMTMVASDGRLVDETGKPVGGTLRDTFPVPPGFNDLPAQERMRYVLRRSIATGGASAVRPAALKNVDIPPGWLHDRWWSLISTAREEMFVDESVVIDYRLSADQEVGLDQGLQGEASVARFVIGVAQAGATLNRLQDLRRELPRYATPAMLPEVSGTRLMRNLM